MGENHGCERWREKRPQDWEVKSPPPGLFPFFDFTLRILPPLLLNCLSGMELLFGMKNAPFLKCRR